MDKDNQPIVLNAKGEQVLYSFDKENKLIAEDATLTADKDANLILPEGYSYIEVQDLDASGVTDNLQEVIDLFGTIPAKDEKDTPLQRVIDGALNWFNVQARKAASPVAEVEKDDELTPLVTDMVKNGVLAQDNVAVWRRAVSTGAKSIEVTRLEFAEMTKEVKKFRKLAVPASV